MKTLLSAIAAGAILSMAALATPASAQGYYGNHYGYTTTTRCDRDGDRCATYRCDRDGDDCRRVSGFYARSHLYNRYSYNNDNRYNRYSYNDRDRDDYGRTVRRCDRDGDDCHYYRCDRDGDNCRRL